MPSDLQEKGRQGGAERMAVHKIAGVVVLLASRAGGFITGQNLLMDGGAYPGTM